METLHPDPSGIKWILDTAHSEIGFKVKHMMITNVKGEFKSFRVEANGPDIFSAGITVAIDAASIDTGNSDRDKHLKSADFLDAANHKELIFKSTSFRKADDGYELKGMLTIRGITHEVVLEVEYGGINTDPWGIKKEGFSITGKISRKAWGVNWNAALETGGVLVGDEVKILAEIELTRQE